MPQLWLVFLITLGTSSRVSGRAVRVFYPGCILRLIGRATVASASIRLSRSTPTMLLFLLVPAVQLYIPAAPALRLALPALRLAPPAMQLRDGNAESSIVVPGGGSCQTWFYDSYVQQVQVVLNTDGRPLDADVEVWQDDFGNNVPWKVHARIESADVSLQNGQLRPFSAVVETPRGPNTVAIRNTGQPINPLFASVGAGPVRCPSSECLSSCTSILRGSSRTYQFDPSVGSIQILLETTEGRPLNARIELLERPNNNKQVVEVYSQDGCDRPLFCILETPRSGSTVSVVNTANDEMIAAVVPQDTNQGMASNAQRLGGRQQGGPQELYGPAFGHGGIWNARDASQRDRNRRQRTAFRPTYEDNLEQEEFLQQFLFQGDRKRRQGGAAFGQQGQQGGYGQQGYYYNQPYNRPPDFSPSGLLKNLFRKSQDGYVQRGDRQQYGFQDTRDRVRREQYYDRHAPGGFQNTRDATQRNRNRRQQDFAQRDEQSGLRRFFQGARRQGGFGQRRDFSQQSFLSTRDQIRGRAPRQQQYGPGLGQGQNGGYMQKGEYRATRGFQGDRNRRRDYGPVFGQGKQGNMQRGDTRQQRRRQGNRQRGADEYAPFLAMSDNLNSVTNRLVRRFSRPGWRPPRVGPP